MEGRDFSKMEEADLVINYTNNRFDKGLNTNLFIIGLSGTGKSSTSIRIAELIVKYRGEETEIFIVDSLLDLLKALRQAREGDIIVVEETSVLFPSRRSMAEENVSINKVMDTCRKRMLTIISNAPLWNSIDSHMRALGHVLIETLRINKKQGVVISKFHRLQTNPLSSKTYRHTMTRNGIDVSRMITRMPSKERWKTYEESKDKFMEELYKRLEAKQLKKKDKEDKEFRIANPKLKQLSPREIQVHQLVNINKLTQTETAKRLGIGQPRVCTILKEINKKCKINEERNMLLRD